MGACSTLLCNNCVKPGKCCTNFILNGGDFGLGETELELRVRLATAVTGLGPDGRAMAYYEGIPDGVEGVQIGLPFEPFHRSSAGVWRFWCPNLRRDGLCGDYENRPPLCRDYTAGQDALCAMHTYTPADPEVTYLDKTELVDS